MQQQHFRAEVEMDFTRPGPAWTKLHKMQSLRKAVDFKPQQDGKRPLLCPQ